VSLKCRGEATGAGEVHFASAAASCGRGEEGGPAVVLFAETLPRPGILL